MKMPFLTGVAPFEDRISKNKRWAVFELCIEWINIPRIYDFKIGYKTSNKTIAKAKATVVINKKLLDEANELENIALSRVEEEEEKMTKKIRFSSKSPRQLKLTHKQIN